MFKFLEKWLEGPLVPWYKRGDQNLLDEINKIVATDPDIDKEIKLDIGWHGEPQNKKS